MASSVERALLEFGGIGGEHLEPRDGADAYRTTTRGSTFVIDPDRCTADPDALEKAAQDSGESGTYPIGHMCGGLVALVMGDSGSVYALRGRQLTCLGKTFDESIESIVRGAPGFRVE